MKNKKETEVIHYTRGDLVIQCGSCGARKVLQKTIKDGISIVLPTTSKALIDLHCDKCDNSMALFWLESSEEDIKNAEAEEAKEKETTEKAEVKKPEFKVQKKEDDDANVPEDNKEEVPV